MNVLITGGYGFIGSHVAERFYTEGHNIYIIDDLSAGSKDNVAFEHKYYNLNIADPKCAEVFKTTNFDCVIHLAAQVDVNTSNSNARLDCEVNVLGLVNMLDLSRKFGVGKFVFASSAAVYGDTKILPTPENASLNPQSVYGINKSIGEYYCKKWNELYGLKTTILRFANVYGPKQGKHGEAGVIATFIKNMLECKGIVIYGDGNQTRDYVYVEDLADALYKAAVSTGRQQIMNVSTTTEHSLNDLLKLLSSFGHIGNIKYDEAREGDIYKSVLNNERVRQELGWKPKYSFKEGLLKTYRWYQLNWKQSTAAVHVEKVDGIISDQRLCLKEQTVTDKKPETGKIKKRVKKTL